MSEFFLSRHPLLAAHSSMNDPDGLSPP
jgi:hypothetical protein